jgi:hypothetical protein
MLTACRRAESLVFHAESTEFQPFYNDFDGFPRRTQAQSRLSLLGIIGAWQGPFWETSRKIPLFRSLSGIAAAQVVTFQSDLPALRSAQD